GRRRGSRGPGDCDLHLSQRAEHQRRQHQFDEMVENAWLIPLFPGLAFLLIVALGRRAPGEGAGIGVPMIGLSLLLSLGVLIGTVAADGAGRYHVRDVAWFTLGATRIDVGYLVDPLT